MKCTIKMGLTGFKNDGAFHVPYCWECKPGQFFPITQILKQIVCLGSTNVADCDTNSQESVLVLIQIEQEIVV